MSKQEAAACLAMILLIDDEKVTRGPTRNWMLKRGTEGLYWNLVQELMVEDMQTYKEMMRMNYETFKKVLTFQLTFIAFASAILNEINRVITHTH